MSNVDPATPPVKDDPAKPYKALWAVAVPVAVAVLTAILNHGTDVTIPPWVALGITAILSGLAVFSQANPKVLATQVRRRVMDEGGYGAVELLVVVVVVIILLVVLFRLI